MPSLRAPAMRDKLQPIVFYPPAGGNVLKGQRLGLIELNDLLLIAIGIERVVYKCNTYIFKSLCCPFRAKTQLIHFYPGRCPGLEYARLSVLLSLSLTAMTPYWGLKTRYLKSYKLGLSPQLGVGGRNTN